MIRQLAGHQLYVFVRSGIWLQLGASQPASHRTAVCVLTPGLYQMAAHNFEALCPGMPLPGGLCTSVHPLYIAVA